MGYLDQAFKTTYIRQIPLVHNSLCICTCASVYVYVSKVVPIMLIILSVILSRNSFVKFTYYSKFILNSVLLQEDLDEVSLWSALWDLSLNPDKSYHVHYHFSSILCNNEYFINMDPISSMHQIKDLSIMFSSDLQLAIMESSL